MRYLLCLALLCACSTTQQAHTYKQSAFPSAPAFNPAWDAPLTVGQPGYVGEPEEVPRSPHRRVLPQTPSTRREAGLWSAEGPRASSRIDPVVLIGVYIPMPDEAEKEEDIGLTRMCAEHFGRSLFNSPELAKEALALPPQRKFCLAIQVLKMCLSMEGLHSALGAEAMRPASDRMLSHLKKTTDDVCSKFEDANDDLVSRFILYVSHSKFEHRTKGPK